MSTLFLLFSLLLFLSPSSLAPAHPRTFDIMVPLGERCGATGKLQQLELRGPNYGLEWLISTPRAVADLVINDFKWFLTPSNFLTIHHDAVFAQRHGPPHYILDRSYGVVLVHDFSINTTDLAEAERESLKMYEYPEVKQTLQRRINRFIKTMERAQKNRQKVLFYRERCGTKADAELLSYALSLRYPLLDFTLLIVSKDAQIISDGEIPHVINRPIPAIDTFDEWKALFGDVVDFAHQKPSSRSPSPKITPQSFEIIIPLGDDASVSRELAHFGFKGPDYGFESCISESPTSIAFALLNNFESFFDPQNFLPLTGDAVTYNRYGLAEYLLDRRYFLRFATTNHPLLPAKNAVSLQEQLTRLHETLSTAALQGTPVLFVRKHATKRQIELLSYALESCYQNLNFTMLVVDSTEEILTDWEVPHVVNRYLPTFIGWAMAENHIHAAWKKVLSEVILFPTVTSEKPRITEEPQKILKRKER